MTRPLPSRTIIALACASLLLGACVQNGMSLRETPGNDYPALAMAFHKPAPATAPAKPITLPIRLAAAQIGELAPPQGMLDALRKDSAFAQVLPVPAPAPAPGEPGNHARFDPRASRAEQASADRRLAEDRAEELCRVARDYGADYLLVFGGTLDLASNDTPLSVLDLTIVGAYVVPGRRITAEGRAAGTLVDVQSGRAVLSVSAQRSGKTLASTAAAPSDELRLLQRMRDQLTLDLAGELSKRVRAAAGEPVAAR